jgi:DNA-binding CsgD family transcriptional regulator
VALRHDETAPRVWTPFGKDGVYATCDPAGWDATGGLSRVVAKSYPVELLDYLFYRRAVDAQASTPFPGFRRPKKPLTRPEARLVGSAKKADRASGINPNVDRWEWEYEQDAFAFGSWRDELPMTRNVKLRRPSIHFKTDVHIAAGLVDSWIAETQPERLGTHMWGSLEQAAMHIDEWAFNAMLVDAGWLRAVYRLSPQQGNIMRFYLKGLRRETIAANLGIGVESVKEQLARALKKIRDLWGLSPASAPLSMRRQDVFKRESKGEANARPR